MSEALSRPKPKPPAGPSAPAPKNAAGAKTQKPAAAAAAGRTLEDGAAAEPHIEPPRRISTQKLDVHKAADPFALKSKHKTNFGSIYQSGGLPCRVNSSQRIFLQWDVPPVRLDYNPLIIVCAEGLLETEHPFVFVAPTAFVQLCEADDATEKIVPLIGKIVPHIRAALAASSEKTFDAILQSLMALAAVCGPYLTEHLGSVLAPLNKKIFEKGFAEKITNALQTIEGHCGPESGRVIKAKIPTYLPLNPVGSSHGAKATPHVAFGSRR